MLLAYAAIKVAPSVERWQAVRRLARAIKDRSVSVEQQSLRWDLAKSALEAELWLKNGASADIVATAVFKLTLNHGRFDAGYLKQISELNGPTEADKAAFLRGLDERKNQNRDYVLNPHVRAVEAYMRRGGKLLPGVHFEPVELDSGTPALFETLFRAHLALRTGEIVKIRKLLELPPAEEGYVATISLQALESVP